MLLKLLVTRRGMAFDRFTVRWTGSSPLYIVFARKPRQVKAGISGGAERAGIGQKLVELVPTYAEYQCLTTREIPLVILE